MKHCPDRELLERLLHSGLADTELDELDLHVKDCASCQQTLEELTDDPIWKPELRHQLTLLSADAAPAHVVDRLGATFVATTAANEREERIAPVVPGYEILGELGRGGMGVVYHARHVRLNRPCALKMILAGAHASPEVLARFVTEAEAIARLAHPSITQIRHIGDAMACRSSSSSTFPAAAWTRSSMAGRGRRRARRSLPSKRPWGLPRPIARESSIAISNPRTCS
jgi:eukaryotic-like serine/threonine-protein kinase